MSILTDKIEALTLVPDAWAEQIMKFQPSLYQRLSLLASELTTVGGALELTTENLVKVDEIMTALRGYMTTGEYLEIVQELDAQFVAQQANTIAYFESTFGEAPVTSFASTLYNIKRAEMLDYVIGNGLNDILYNPVRSTLIEGIASGSSYSDLLTNLRTISVGDETLDGYLLRYSRQIVSDTLATTDRQFTNIIGNELGLEWYRYVGGRMQTTRCFCNERNGKWYHRKEIEAWGDMEGLGDCKTKDGGWAGMYRGTNSETIFSYVGGYNCQHSLLPVSEAAVPKEFVAQAKAKGYI